MANEDRIQGLLGNPIFNTGIGLLAAGLGQPQNLGQGLLGGLQAGQGLQQGALRNQAARDKMTERARQRQVGADTEQFIQSLGPTQIPLRAGPNNGLLNQEQVNTLGLLAQSDPNAALSLLGQQFFPQERSDPSDIRTLDALGLPRTPEGFEALQKLKGGNIDDLLKRVQLETLLDERERGGEERTLEREQRQISTQETLQQGKNILELTNRLEGTFLEPGRVGIDLRRPFTSLLGEAASLFGEDEFAAKQQQLVQDFDTFRKDSVDFVLGMTNKFGTRLTNFQLETLQKASAGEDVSPAAIKSVVTGVMRRTLSDADARGDEIAEREQFEALLNDFESGPSDQETSRESGPSALDQAVESARGAAGAVRDGARSTAAQVRRIGRMGREQLNRLDLQSASDEVLRAAADRWDELQER